MSALDAGRGEINAAIYDELGVPVYGPSVTALSDAAELAKKYSPVLAGSAAIAIAAEASGRFDVGSSLATADISVYAKLAALKGGRRKAETALSSRGRRQAAGRLRAAENQTMIPKNGTVFRKRSWPNEKTVADAHTFPEAARARLCAGAAHHHGQPGDLGAPSGGFRPAMDRRRVREPARAGHGVRLRRPRDRAWRGARRSASYLPGWLPAKAKS